MANNRLDPMAISGPSLMGMPSFNPVVEELINQFNLSTCWTARVALQKASELPADRQYLALVAHTLLVTEEVRNLRNRTDQKLASLVIMHDKIAKDLSTLTRYCARTWTLSEPQVGLITKIVKHFLIQPVLEYGELTAICAFNFVKAHAQQLKLDGLITEPVLRQAIMRIVERTEEDERQKLEDAISSSLRVKMSLDVFVSRLINDFWGAEDKPSSVRKRSITAQIAEARSSMKACRWSGEGFWLSFNASLNNLAALYGPVPNRNSDTWRDWENKVIERDVDEYGTGSQGTNALATGRQIGLTAKIEALTDTREDQIM
ncbi:hypothetical protein NM688_g4498 [Phlebia brevispora]|uniref:Uncharacterized protein n=1 Tax=Phlebia brevispora TaxID=194682 RepID=A0ACC1T2X8_9APHY|nr:hypothetical protein NM688_g4498 [Phlebia brevispora]